MQLARSLPRPLNLPPLWLAGAIFASALLALQVMAAMLLVPAVREGGTDWTALTDAGRWITNGASPYTEPKFRWSPLAAYWFAAIAPIGLLGWSLLHVAVLPLLRDWRLIGVVALSWPFWFDLDVGNAMIFVTVAGFTAFRGSRIGEVAWFVLAVLIPRPLVLPLTAWLLWKRPHTRLPFLVILLAGIAGAWATGYGAEWFGRLTESGADMNNFWNLAPSRWIGWWWMPIALGLAGWLTLKGRIGLASVVVTPYILPQYLLMLVLAARTMQPVVKVLSR